MPEHAAENTEFALAEKSTQISLAVYNHACVFPQSQADNSL
jgi:hypothetical protein